MAKINPADTPQQRITLPEYIQKHLPKPLVINPTLSINHFFRVLEQPSNKKSSTIQYVPYLFKTLQNHSVSNSQLCTGALTKLAASLTERNQRLADTYPNSITIAYQPRTALILGASSPSPYSTVNLLKLHQLYGLPYLSASSLKGSFRSFWILKYFGGSEEAALQDAAFRQLFGAADEDAHVGALVFFDTFPTKFTLTLDIQTPHYPDYYSGSKPPTDTQSPIPIYVLCLQDADFAIPIACKDPVLWQNEQAKIQETFTALLTTYGLGAKTALGYGLDSDEPPS